MNFPSSMRDLRWLISSPPLISEKVCPLVDESEIAQLRRLLSPDEKPIPALTDEISSTPRHYKLGIYCEALLNFALKHAPHLKLIASHLPVFREQKSVGEFDFIVGSVGAQTAATWEHWEMAVKFYCLSDLRPHPHQANPGDFLGPEGRDTLSMKLKKLLDRQISLGQTPAGKEALEKLGLNTELGCGKVFSRGIFFYPFSDYLRARDDQSACKSALNADFIHPLSAEGAWARRHESEFALHRLTRGKSAHFAIRQRLGWITPPDSPGEKIHTEIEFDTLADVSAYLAEKSDPEGVLVDILPEKGGKERIFILNDRWPATRAAEN